MAKHVVVIGNNSPRPAGLVVVVPDLRQLLEGGGHVLTDATLPTDNRHQIRTVTTYILDYFA
jgi:hypothetical protein